MRFGLVMYGGVSLAIYINGVAHELFRAVRGRGTYRLLKALTDSDVVVDVLSGTSAGGINGILLAYALSKGCEFECTGKLWREHGDIGQLLRKPDRPIGEYISLLDSEGYYQSKLEQAFADLDRNTVDRGRIVEDPSPIDELDLFITGTDFHGRVSVTTDDAGHPIQVKDHRTVFWLKHRRGRKEPFARDSGARDEPKQGLDCGHSALAKLARITSCFPAAFAPVKVGTTTAIDQKLRFWGQLGDTGERVLIDGGVLDNKPFTSALGAIYSRMSERPVDRCLLYVEPDPERFGDQPEQREIPSVASTAVQSLITIPGYESIADDLRSLSQHNDSVRRIARLLTNLGSDSVVVEEASYRRIRLAGLYDRIFAPLFELRNSAVAGAPAAVEARSALRNWYMDNVVGSAELAQRLLEHDVDFWLRRLMHLRYAFNVELVEGERTHLLRALNRQVQLLEIVRAAMVAAVEAAEQQWLEPPPPVPDDAWAKRVWDDIAARLASACAVEPPPSYRPTPLPAVADVLPAEELREFDTRIRTERSRSGGGNLLAHAQQFELRLLANEPAMQETYANFDRIDRVVHPIEVISEIREKDIIDVERISPVDARLGLSDRDILAKLCGHRIGHFAAFFKRSWRSNDILWGRLDGACQLVQRLLDVRRQGGAIFATVARPQARAALRGLVAELADDPGALPLPEVQRAALLAWLGDVCAEDPERRERALARLTGETLPDDPRLLLVLSAQHEVLRENLASVFTDAADEQLSWNLYRRTSPGAGVAALELDPRSMAFVAGEHPLDPTAVAGAVAIASRQALDKVTSRPEDAATFFTDHYRVAAETLDAVPRLVLIDTLARALVAARNCILATLGDRAEAVQSHPMYQIFLGWPLRALLAITGMLRRAPKYEGAFVLGALSYIALSVIVIAFWHTPIIQDEHGLRLGGSVMFLGMPLVLGAVVRFMVTGRSASSAQALIAAALAWAAGLAALIVSLPVLIGIMEKDGSGYCSQIAGAARALWVPLPAQLTELAGCEANGKLATLFDVGRWIVLGASALGAIAMSNLFGRLWRGLRALSVRVRRLPAIFQVRASGQDQRG